MTDKLGVYWSVMHRRPQDYDYFKRQQPSVFKIMDGGTGDYSWADSHLPDSVIVARDWALSEQHDDMLRDPAGTGQRHAEEWHTHQQRLGFDPAKTLVLGINEPRIWEPDVPEALRLYTVAMCDEASKLGLRVGAMQLAVGWPNNTGTDTPPDWSPWHGVEDAIKRGRHMLVLHEYWADNGPGENWGWWAGRSLKCPWQVPIVIGECGIDMQVKDGSVAANQRGWQGRMHPTRYAQELADYVGRMSVDSRFIGCAVFASDFASHEWYSFDIEPAYQAILATPIPDVKPDAKPVETHLPSIQNGKPTAIVDAPAGANIRSGPGLDYPVLGAEPYGTVMEVIGKNEAGDWWQVEMEHVTGWVNGMIVKVSNVAGVPVVSSSTPSPSVPQPLDTWEASYPFVLNIEGGMSLDPNDPGNWYNGQLVGTKYGISAAVWGGQYDIHNLTQAQALDIYRKHYWEASGADKLPWPMCLIVFDTAINHGVGVAQKLLSSQPSQEEIYLGQRALRYFDDPNWRLYGEAWGVRVGNLHDIVKERD